MQAYYEMANSILEKAKMVVKMTRFVYARLMLRESSYICICHAVGKVDVMSNGQIGDFCSVITFLTCLPDKGRGSDARTVDLRRLLSPSPFHSSLSSEFVGLTTLEILCRKDVLCLYLFIRNCCESLLDGLYLKSFRALTASMSSII